MIKFSSCKHFVFLSFFILSVGSVSASTWSYSDPLFSISDPDNPEWTLSTCGHVPYSVTQDTLGVFLNINVTFIDYYPLPLPVETYIIVNYTDPYGTITQYDLRETNWYWGTGLNPVHLESSIPYQVGTYDVVGGVSEGMCQLIVDPSVASVYIISTEYGNGWKKEYLSNGKVAYSNYPTYLRWDNVWIPEEWLNISNGNWSYKIEDVGTRMNFTADGKTISVPKLNTNFDLQLFKVSPSLIYSKTALLNNMVNVNATVAYLTFPYSLSQIHDYADENNIKIGRWIFKAGSEHINIYDDVLVNHTYVDITGLNETYLAVTTLPKAYYQFRIINGDIRLYFLKSEADKLNGNITFALNSWSVGESGNAWIGNSIGENTTLNRDRNRVNLQQSVNDYLSFWRLDGSSGIVSYDENVTSDNTGTLTGSTWVEGKYNAGVNFDGANDKVDFGTISELAGLNKLTVLVWTKPTTLTTSDAIIHNWNATSPYSGFYLGTGTSTVTSTLWGIVGGYGQSALTLSNGAWSHLSMVYDGTESTDALRLKGYVNGNQATLTFGATIPTTIGTSNIPLMMGVLNDYSRDYNGVSDDFRLFTRVLTNDEINQSKNNEMVSLGNRTTWYDLGSVWQGNQIKVTFTNDSNSFVDLYTSADGTVYSLVQDNATNNTYYDVPEGFKNQTQYIRVVLKGNTTSTPDIISTTVLGEYVGTTVYIGTMQNLTEVSGYVNNVSILENKGDGIWLLNANLVNNNTANTFYMNETDVIWLKINSTNSSGTPTCWYYLTNGKTEVNNIKITSWNTTSGTEEGLPASTWARSSVYASSADSKINWTNSNGSYLGYNVLNKYGVFYTSSSGNKIVNSTFIGNYRGLSFLTSSNNNISDNYVYSDLGYGLMLSTSSNSNILTNNTVTSNSNHGVYLSASTDNILTSNTFNTNSVTTTIGAIVSDTSDRTNNFIDTDFTSNPLKVRFISSLTSEFNQSQDVGVSFVSTNVSIARITNRSIINWDQSNITFTETFTGTTQGNYVVSGLFPDTDYFVYNGTSLDYSLTTDSIGMLSNFTINFSTSPTVVKIVQYEDTILYERFVTDSISYLDTLGSMRSFFRSVTSTLSVSDNVKSLYTGVGELFIRYASDLITVTEDSLTFFWESVLYTVSGYVYNVLSLPLENARIEYTGDSGNYSFTDSSGYYSISVPGGDNRTILSRAIGYRNSTNISEISDNSTINFTMSEKTYHSVNIPGFDWFLLLFAILSCFILRKVHI